jgi:hypothetical protein
MRSASAMQSAASVTMPTPWVNSPQFDAPLTASGSGQLRKTDIIRPTRLVRFVPKAVFDAIGKIDSCTKNCYSPCLERVEMDRRLAAILIADVVG